MKQLVFVISMLMIGFAGIGPTWAQEDKPFDKKELAKFIADFPAIADYVEKMGQRIDPQADPGAWQHLLTAKSYVGFLEKQGWRPERFAYVLSHVGAGLAALSMAEYGPALKAQLSQAEKAIKDNPGLSEEMKAQLLNQMQEGMGASAQLSNTLNGLPAEEISLIKQNKEKLMDILDR